MSSVKNFDAGFTRVDAQILEHLKEKIRLKQEKVVEQYDRNLKDVDGFMRRLEESSLDTSSMKSFEHNQRKNQRAQQTLADDIQQLKYKLHFVEEHGIPTAIKDQMEYIRSLKLPKPSKARSRNDSGHAAVVKSKEENNCLTSSSHLAGTESTSSALPSTCSVSANTLDRITLDVDEVSKSQSPCEAGSAGSCGSAASSNSALRDHLYGTSSENSGVLPTPIVQHHKLRTGLNANNSSRSLGHCSPAASLEEVPVRNQDQVYASKRIKQLEFDLVELREKMVKKVDEIQHTLNDTKNELDMTIRELISSREQERQLQAQLEDMGKHCNTRFRNLESGAEDFGQIVHNVRVNLDEVNQRLDFKVTDSHDNLNDKIGEVREQCELIRRRLDNNPLFATGSTDVHSVRLATHNPFFLHCLNIIGFLISFLLWIVCQTFNFVNLVSALLSSRLMRATLVAALLLLVSRRFHGARDLWHRVAGHRVDALILELTRFYSSDLEVESTHSS